MNHEELQWIDFETEIQNVLEDTEEYSMESIPKNVGKLGSDGLPERLERIPRIFGEKADNYINFGVVEVLEHYADKRELKKNKQQLIKHMVKELDKLILCLNYYLEDFVGSIQCDWCSEQVMEIGQVFLLNFNYTTTFQTVYEEHNIIEHHAVHGGVADKNIILGISDDSFPETHDYIRFQKYFQRIQKRTGANYLNWTTTEDDDVGGYKW